MDNSIDVLKQLITGRRSIFPANYTEEPIARPVIEAILESANYAPSHKLTEPWRFSVFIGEGKLRLGSHLAELYTTYTPSERFLQKKYDSIQLKAQQAGCIMAVKAQLHPDKLPEWEEIAAMACAVQNMSLTATAYNIGSYWSSPAMANHLGPFLNLKQHERCFGLLYFGHHNAPERKAIRTPMDSKVDWITD